MKRKWLAMFLVCLLLPTFVSANAAEPPTYVIIVPGATDELSLVMEDAQGVQSIARREQKFSESYYLFYASNMAYTKSPELLVRHEGVEQRVPLPTREITYNNLYTLNPDTMTLTKGKLPFRTLLFTLARVAVTLLIEGLVFYLFGYRKRASWIWFLLINLMTQALLAWYLYRQILDISYTFALGLILVELIIVGVEALFFTQTVKEHRSLRALLFVLVANPLSFLAGYMLLRHLPF